MAGEAVYSARWAVADTDSFSGSSVRWDFNGDTVVKTQPILANSALRGTRATITPQTRYGPYSIGGSLSINPSPKFLGWALPKVMGGGTETSPVFADAVPSFFMVHDRGTGTSTTLGECYKYSDVKMNRLTLSSRANGLVECGIDILGKLETSGITFAGAALGTTLAYEPFQHADSGLVWNSGGSNTSLELLEWNLTIDNGLTPRFATGSLTASEILEGPRRVTFNAMATLNAAAVTDTVIAGLVKDGVAGTLLMANSTVSALFTFARLQIPPNSIRINGNEFTFPIMGEVRGSTGLEMTATLDVTP